MKYSCDYSVNVHDTDYNRRLSATGVLRYMQDCVNLQMEAESPSYDELMDMGYSFVLSRIRVEVKRPAAHHERITAKTWACPSRGLSFDRCYTLEGDGGVIAEAGSSWGLINLNDGKLCRVGTLDLAYGEDEPLEVLSRIRMRIPDPSALRCVGTHTVTYAEVDVNRHLNNTRYADMFCGFLPMDGKFVSSFAISFLTEAPLGETLGVYSEEADGRYYFRTVRGDGKTNAEAEFTLSDI